MSSLAPHLRQFMPPPGQKMQVEVPIETFSKSWKISDDSSLSLSRKATLFKSSTSPAVHDYLTKIRSHYNHPPQRSGNGKGINLVRLKILVPMAISLISLSLGLYA